MPSEPNPQQVAAHSVLNGPTSEQMMENKKKKKIHYWIKREVWSLGFIAPGAANAAAVCRGVYSILRGIIAVKHW